VIRTILTRLHRTIGLALAIFLAVAGLSGSIIVFYAELDRALNPELYRVAPTKTRLMPSALATRVERQLPGSQVSLVSIPAPGWASEVWVRPVKAPLGYDQVFADPATGKILGKRQWGAAGVSRAALMPMLYAFHYTLKLPGIVGLYLMGIIGCIWTIDCVVAFALTLPRGRRVWNAPFWTKWRTSWRIKPNASPYRFTFDLHRAGGLWVWAVLIVLASSGVALNLPEQVFRPLLKSVATLSPTLDEIRPPSAVKHTPKLSFDDALRLGKVAPQWVFREPEHGVVGVSYGSGDRGLDGFGLSTQIFDDQSGRLVMATEAGSGRLADIYAGMQYQLHSGRILGWPGRILVSVTGVMVAMLSLTGVRLWVKRRRARRDACRQDKHI
jgi:uncharacterized iron-regulated membrane protein